MVSVTSRVMATPSGRSRAGHSCPHMARAGSDEGAALAVEPGLNLPLCHKRMRLRPVRHVQADPPPAADTPGISGLDGLSDVESHCQWIANGGWTGTDVTGETGFRCMCTPTASAGEGAGDLCISRDARPDGPRDHWAIRPLKEKTSRVTQTLMATPAPLAPLTP